MAIKKVRIKPPGYTDIVHPETSADVVIEYERGWANKEQLRIWVTKNKLSNLEYKEICNEEFR